MCLVTICMHFFFGEMSSVLLLILKIGLFFGPEMEAN